MNQKNINQHKNHFLHVLLPLSQLIYSKATIRKFQQSFWVLKPYNI